MTPLFKLLNTLGEDTCEILYIVYEKHLQIISSLYNVILTYNMLDTHKRVFKLTIYICYVV